MIFRCDWKKLAAFGASSGLWTGAVLVLSLGDLGVVLAAAGFFAFFSLMVAAVRRAAGTVLAAWAGAMLLIGIAQASSGSDSMIGDVIVASVALGTAAVAGWMFVGFLLLLLFDPSRRSPRLMTSV